MTTIPSIACLGVIGKNNNPLHIALFPSYPHPTPLLSSLQFSLHLTSCLDIFEMRLRPGAITSSGGTSNSSQPLTGDLGLLHCISDRLAAYGFETNTGIKFIAIIDMLGRHIPLASSSSQHTSQDLAPANNEALAVSIKEGGVPVTSGLTGMGLRDGDLKPVFKAMQAAWVALLQNPFFEVDNVVGRNGGGNGKQGNGKGGMIRSRRFEGEMRRIGEGWRPGMVGI